MWSETTDRGDGGLVPVRAEDDVLAPYRGTPIGHLLAAQNLGRPFPVGPTPSLMIATCIDSRVRLQLPRGAAFELRSAGVNLETPAFFQIAFVVTVIGVRHVALACHDDCAMSTLRSRRSAFVEGLVGENGWSEKEATAFFRAHADDWQLDDPIANVLEHARVLRQRFPAATFVPLHYSVHDGRLQQIAEDRAG